MSVHLPLIVGNPSFRSASGRGTEAFTTQCACLGGRRSPYNGFQFRCGRFTQTAITVIQAVMPHHSGFLDCCWPEGLSNSDGQPGRKVGYSLNRSQRGGLSSYVNTM